MGNVINMIGGGKPEQEKTVTAGTAATTVTPDSGKTLKKVTVDPTPTESKTVTPTTSEQTITPSSGKHLSKVIVKAMEDVAPEVTAQVPIIANIAESLGVEITTPSGSNKEILQRNNMNLQLIAGYEPAFKIVTWAGGTDEEILKMVRAADAGLIDLTDYWSVGDIRTVQLSAMAATYVGESHTAQKVDLVLMHAGGYKLHEAVASGRTTCSFVVGQKDLLTTTGYMNPSMSSALWSGCIRNTWCNEVYKNALPSTLLPIFKQFLNPIYNGNSVVSITDWFALPAAKEVYGGSASVAGKDTGYSNLDEFNALFQFAYYATSSNRIKKLGKTGNTEKWWLRSPAYNNTYAFCYVGSSGVPGSDYGYNTHGVAPFGCI